MNTNLSMRERTVKVSNINENIINVPDDILTNIYSNIVKITKEKIKKDVDRVEKVKYIENNLRYINDTNIIEIEEIMNDANNDQIEETDEEKKKRIVLEIINKLLVAMNKDEINDLCKFKDIHRDDLINDVCKNILEENKTYISDNGFDDLHCSMYEARLKYPQISMLKYILKKINYDLKSKSKSKIIDGERNVSTVYFIKEDEK